MNEQNLRPCEYQLTQEEQKKGGVASGVARREKKTAKMWAQMMADALLKGKDGQPMTNPLTGEPQTAIAAAVYKQYEKAIKNGDTAALKVLLELLGEIKGESIQVNTAFIQRTPEEAYTAAYGVIEGEAGEDTTEGEKCEN